MLLVATKYSEFSLKNICALNAANLIHYRCMLNSFAIFWKFFKLRAEIFKNSESFLFSIQKFIVKNLVSTENSFRVKFEMILGLKINPLGNSHTLAWKFCLMLDKFSELGLKIFLMLIFISLDRSKSLYVLRLVAPSMVKIFG